MCGAIRQRLAELGGGLGAGAVVQYGGSVSPDNAGDLLAVPDIDGLLVGGASLDATKFHAIATARH
jgi:triosephosphate isomerase